MGAIVPVKSDTRKLTKLTTILGQPSWRIVTPQVEAFSSPRGWSSCASDVQTERAEDHAILVSPWSMEKSIQRDRKTPSVIKALRGDFFCMPFGGNSSPFNREHHPAHGEVANANWKFESLKKNEGPTLRLSLATKVRRGGG